MTNEFQELLQALKDSAEEMMASSQALARGGAAITRAVDAAIKANGEHEDLREPLRRLEALALESADQIRRLRADVTALRERLNGR